jgi:hypothetical protein
MIVNLARRDGDNVLLERIDGEMVFVGGAAQEGVLVTFEHDGREVTGRIIKVADDPEAEPGVEIELIDEEVHDLESEITLANLPPGNDTDTKI